MNRFTVYIIFFISFIHTFSTAQPIVLTDKNIEFTHITPIFKDTGTIGEFEKSNLKVNLDRPTNMRIIDDTGNRIIVNGKLIQGLKQNNRIIDLPNIDIPDDYSISSSAKFGSDEDTIFILSGHAPLFGEKPRIFKFHSYNLLNGQLSQLFSKTFDDPVHTDFKISCDGSTITEDRGVIIHLHALRGAEYVETVHGPHWTLIQTLISKFGNRVVYLIQRERDDPLQWVYVDKLADGWTEEKTIPIPPLQIEGQEVSFEIWAIANDGKTIILKSNDLSSYEVKKNHLAVIHEEDGNWSQPVYVGSFDFRRFPIHDGTSRDGLEAPDDITILSSDDGRVIAVRQRKTYFEPLGASTYDAYVFINNADGEWVKQKINPEGVEIAMQDILLSGDGSKLLWVPTMSQSGLSMENQFK